MMMMSNTEWQPRDEVIETIERALDDPRWYGDTHALNS